MKGKLPMNRHAVVALQKANANQKIFMEVWLGKQINGASIVAFDMDDFEQLTKCGTVGCIAGTTCILFPDNINTEEDVCDNAIEILGIDDAIASRLFYRSRWPDFYRNLPEQEGLAKIFEKALEDGSFDFILDE